MSVCSDDTDVLVLLPPNLFVVQDEFDASGFFGVDERPLEEPFLGTECVVEGYVMRRYGSADPLTPSSNYSTRPRSLQNTPLKCWTPYRNLLTSDAYLMQREQDEQSLKEIDEYFKEKKGGEPCVPTLDLPYVQDFITKMEETERSIAANNVEPSTVGVRRILNFDSPSKKDNLQELSIETENSSREQLVSLNNLWTGNPKTTMYEELKVLRQRLEEERMRRQHCEEIIRDLQKQLLESREKVAIACKVDEDKDNAIQRLREGWQRASEQWKECDAQKNELAKKLSENRETFDKEKENLSASVKRLENELLKALDLVHEYKEERRSAVKVRDTVAAEFSDARQRLQECDVIVDELNKKIKEKDDVIDKNRVRMDELSNLCKDLKKQLKGMQNDKNRLALEREAKNVIQKKLDETLKREGNLQEQLKAAAKNKNDLKQYYQDQVENLVMEKQKEFQMQLASVEKTLQKEMTAKERALVDGANNDKLQLIEKHKFEIAVLEKKQQQEIELFKIKIAQCHERIGDLEGKLVDQKDRQQELCEKLYGVVQTQWMETIKTISVHFTRDGKQSNLKRQNTFTKDNDIEATAKEGNKGGIVRRAGSVTYRVNETPEKIPMLKDYIEQLIFERDGNIDDSLSTNCVRNDVKMNSSQNSVQDASSSSKDKGKPKSPWK